MNKARFQGEFQIDSISITYISTMVKIIYTQMEAEPC